jgi:tetratricopeptide (TPR) repeat protein
MKTLIITFILFICFACSQKHQVPESSIKRGVLLIDQEAYQTAIDYFQSLIKDETNEISKAVIYRNISISFQSLNQLDSAKYYAKKSYLESPEDSFEYFLNKADYNLLVNHVSEAIQNLNKAKSIDSKRQEVYNRFCSVYSGEYGEVFFEPDLAEKNALIACKIKPNRIVKEQLGSIYFQNEKYHHSARIFNELVKKYPENKKYTFFMGQALYFDGNENRGLDLMKQAAERDDSCKVMFQEIFENL